MEQSGIWSINHVINILIVNDKIKIEEAKDQKTEEIPMFQTYYVVFTRYAGSEWMGGISSQNKKDVIDNLRTYYNTNYEVKIVSFKLPF